MASQQAGTREREGYSGTREEAGGQQGHLRGQRIWGGGRLGGAETPWTGPELAAKHTVRREECVEYLPTVFYAQGTIHTLSHLTPIASLYTVLLQFYRLRK